MNGLHGIDYGMAIYFAPMLVLWIGYAQVGARKQRRNRTALEQATRAGLTEPASLHPAIDPARCLGCGSCASDCPEGDVIGVIDGRARLINPTHCIGHGACKLACPFNAITLVFGSEKRGVDIPTLNTNFETNVPGIFIAGELGGMGLIRNAIEQGRQAVDAIRKYPGVGKGDKLDVLIIGAGPAGLSASLAAMQHKLRFVTVEQDSLGGTVAHYPRGKLVMTAPVKLPYVGKMTFTETTKEALLEFWQGVVQKSGVKINDHERMEDIVGCDDGFLIKTTKGEYSAHTVLLAIGRRGTPRQLGVPGEELPKVVYRLIDPEQYRDRRVLVVGGGDSALEAALSIAEEPNTTVTVSYRAEAFSRAKEQNRHRIDEAQGAGRLRVLFESNVKCIDTDQVEIEQRGETIALPNDSVIVSAGGVLPTPFLKKIGIEVETKYGTA